MRAVSFSAGSGGTTGEGEERSLRQRFSAIPVPALFPWSIRGASGCRGRAVTRSTALRLPAAVAPAARQCLQATSAAALPTGSAHPQRADGRALMVRERRQLGV